MPLTTTVESVQNLPGFPDENALASLSDGRYVIKHTDPCNTQAEDNQVVSELWFRTPVSLLQA